MEIYKCDVCNREFNKEKSVTLAVHRDVKKIPHICRITENDILAEDLCPECYSEIVNKIAEIQILNKED